MMKTPFLKIILAICVIAYCQILKSEIYIHSIKSSEPNQLVSAIKPHLSTETVITVKDYQLIVQGTAQEIDKVKRLIQQLDKAAEKLLIEVMSSSQKLSEAERMRAAIDISNDQSQLKLSYQKRYSTNKGRQHFQVRGLEGAPAFIASGRSIPLTAIFLSPYQASIQSQLVDVQSGFYVSSMRTSSGKIHSRISMQKAALSQPSKNLNSGQSIEKTRIETQVSGLPGEWVLIGSQQSGSSSHSTYSSQKQDSSNLWIYLKVTVL